ncbi:MAG: hypothetical protein SCH71_16765 [Desulfobulbaceae bacterium]|nr:hypothetical protein [Desulfobulbaceae bacterium]
MKKKIKSVVAAMMTFIFLGVVQVEAMPKNPNASTCADIQESCDEHIRQYQDSCQNVERDLAAAATGKQKEVMMQSVKFTKCNGLRSTVATCKRNVIACIQNSVQNTQR